MAVLYVHKIQNDERCFDKGDYKCHGRVEKAQVKKGDGNRYEGAKQQCSEDKKVDLERDDVMV